MDEGHAEVGQRQGHEATAIEPGRGLAAEEVSGADVALGGGGEIATGGHQVGPLRVGLGGGGGEGQWEMRTSM